MSVETYNVERDFSAGVDVEKLHGAITADATITTNALAVTSHDGDCKIEFSSALSGDEKTALDALVAAHTPRTDVEKRKDFLKSKVNATITLTQAEKDSAIATIDAASTDDELRGMKI